MFSLYIYSLLINVHNWLSYSFLEIYSLPAIIIVDKLNDRAAIKLGSATHSSFSFVLCRSVELCVIAYRVVIVSWEISQQKFPETYSNFTGYFQKVFKYFKDAYQLTGVWPALC